MTAFHSIVVPVELGARDERALDAAREVAEGAEGAEIRILHVIPASAGGPVSDVKALYTRLAGQVEAQLRALAGPLEEDGLAVRTDLWLGDEVEETIRFAADLGSGALLVLVPMPDGLPQRRATLDALVQRAPCSVLLVR